MRPIEMGGIVGFSFSTITFAILNCSIISSLFYHFLCHFITSFSLPFYHIISCAKNGLTHFISFYSDISVHLKHFSLFLTRINQWPTYLWLVEVLCPLLFFRILFDCTVFYDNLCVLARIVEWNFMKTPESIASQLGVQHFKAIAVFFFVEAF